MGLVIVFLIILVLAMGAVIFINASAMSCIMERLRRVEQETGEVNKKTEIILTGLGHKVHYIKD